MKTLIEAFLDAPLGSAKRRAKSRDDFGDNGTVGYHLRMVSFIKYKDDIEKRCFGIYLGEQDGKFYVGTMNTFEFAPTDLECFDSLSDLKQVWELD